MANTIKVGDWTASLRAMIAGITGECYRARAVLAMASALLASAADLVGKAETREGGLVAARSLRDDLTQAQSRFASYQVAVDDAGDGTDVDSRIRCESVVQYLLDGRTSDATMPALAQPDASAAASLWNRAVVLSRTLDPATPDPDASDVLSKAADDAGSALAGAGAAALAKVDEWREKIGDIGADIAKKAEAIAIMLAVGLGIGFALWLLLRK